MADFDERSGIVACQTRWGLWYQTLDEVSIEITVPLSTKSRDVKVNLSGQSLLVIVANQQMISGKLYGRVVPSELIWTLESSRDQGKTLRVILVKNDKTISNTWSSLLVDDYSADVWLFENMKKKAALEKMSLENPGYDLSGAEITGNYATGGPDVPS